VAQRPELTQLGQTETGELLFLAVEHLLADAEAAADLGDSLAAFGLVQAWMISSLQRPLRGIVSVSLAGMASLCRKSQILRFHLSAVPIFGFWVSEIRDGNSQRVEDGRSGGALTHASRTLDGSGRPSHRSIRSDSPVGGFFQICAG
jgi:hypothetical protein